MTGTATLAAVRIVRSPVQHRTLGAMLAYMRCNGFPPAVALLLTTAFPATAQLAVAPPGAVQPAPPVDLARPPALIRQPGSPLIIRETPAAQAPPEARTVEATVTSITLDGVTAYPAEELRPYYADLIGRRVAVAELYEAARRIEMRYRRYTDWFKAHVDRNGRELVNWTRGNQASGDRNPLERLGNTVQGTGGAANCLQLRGEYLYVAAGKAGFRVFDVASIANKGVSDKILTAPVSPLGQRAYVTSANATCMALPTNQPINPLRNTPAMRALNQEQAFDPIYHYAVVTDAVEGLILVNVDTLADGEPRNNFLKRAVTWNPDGALTGARHVTLAGHIAYVTTLRGLVVVDLADPLRPRLAASVPLTDPRASYIQFRYLWITTAEGLRVLDVTHLTQPRLLPAIVPLADARRVYVARTYAYVAAGRDGLVIIDVTNPEAPRLYRRETFGGRLNDASDVVVGATNASLFAYVADGANGMKVVQLTSPASQPNFYGFSPAPMPELIAWAKTPSPARALSRGLDRDRAVDETGSQIAVFGRLGSRPFTRAEMERFYLNRAGRPWMVSDQATLADWVAARP